MTENYLIISSDTHASPPVAEYEPYLDTDFRQDYRAYMAEYVSMRERFRVMRAEAAAKREDAEAQTVEIFRGNEDIRNGIEGAWDIDVRRRQWQREGIAGEVVFPDLQNDNAPPFGAFSGASGSWSPEQRVAGAKAYNRWLAEFCAQEPARLKGLALLPIYDVDDAITELREAHKAGLRGVLVDSCVDDRTMYCDSRFDPLWAACEELDMPLHNHHGNLPRYGDSPHASNAVGSPIGRMEFGFYARRMLWVMIFGGVLDKFPRLKLCFTEQGADWVPAILDRMEASTSRPALGATSITLARTPREYWAQNCAVGASFATQPEVHVRHDIGVDNLLWGSDYPHFEGSWPESWLEISDAFTGVPDQELRKMVGLNAARFYNFDVEQLQPFVDTDGPPAGTFANGNRRDHAYTPLDYAQGVVFVDEIYRRSTERIQRTEARTG